MSDRASYSLKRVLIKANEFYIKIDFSEIETLLAAHQVSW